jgi:hypothetical protein
MTKKWLIATVMGVVSVGLLACDGSSTLEGEHTTSMQELPPYEELGTEQPIAFPHDVHARDFQIDCQYCHFSAERSVSAGLPPVATCMGCHAVISGSQNPEEVQTLRDYWSRAEAIPWVRVYKVSDHVRFPHMRHIAAGVDCTSCHGDVQEIGVINEVAQDLSMGWCVSCHVENDASRDCAVCHY